MKAQAESAPQQAVLTLDRPRRQSRFLIARSHRDSVVEARRDRQSAPSAFPSQILLKWDNEHPNLYRLSVSLESGGKAIGDGHAADRFPPGRGSRHPDVREQRAGEAPRRLPARGASVAGRSLTPEQWRQGRRDLPRGQLQLHPHLALSAGRGVRRGLRRVGAVRRTGGAVVLGRQLGQHEVQEPGDTRASSSTSCRSIWKRCRPISTIRR